jgi:hypothetical protein
MGKLKVLFVIGFLCAAPGCSPRQFLTRRLAFELIANSDAFKATQRFWLRTGIVSNKDYISPEYLVLQRRGWLTGSTANCPPEIGPPPCWEVALTPLGVDAFHGLVQSKAAESGYFSVPAAKRQLSSVTGISKNEEMAQVEFQWKWVPLNEVGGAVFSGSVQYESTVAFRRYDDGWRLMEGAMPKTYQDLDDALKNSQSAQ